MGVSLYAPSIFPKAGKAAGNQTMSNYTRNIEDKYDECLSKLKKQKEKPAVEKNNEDFGLYL